MLAYGAAYAHSVNRTFSLLLCFHLLPAMAMGVKLLLVAEVVLAAMAEAQECNGRQCTAEESLNANES